jgi:hypothetical protein
LALARMAFEPSHEISPGGLDMASPTVEEQLVSGWYEPEQTAGRSYRWATGHAAGVVRLAGNAGGACLSYRLPPVRSDVRVTVRPLDQQEPVWSTLISWEDAEWHEDSLPLRLGAGDYLISFDAEAPWSNPKRRDPALWAENRILGFALSSLSFSEQA